jgi:hypothetical protein
MDTRTCTSQTDRQMTDRQTDDRQMAQIATDRQMLGQTGPSLSRDKQDTTHPGMRFQSPVVRDTWYMGGD